MSDKASLVFNQVNIVSGDTEASLRFYRKLGMDISDSAVWKTQSGAHHITAQRVIGHTEADLDIDSTMFAGRWCETWMGRSDLAGRVVMSFQVPTREGVDAIYKDMTAAGFRSLQRPYDAFWGARYAMIEDPDGIAVGLMSPVSAELKSPPPAI